MMSLFLCLHPYYTIGPWDWVMCLYCYFIQLRVYLGTRLISVKASTSLVFCSTTDNHHSDQFLNSDNFVLATVWGRMWKKLIPTSQGANLHLRSLLMLCSTVSLQALVEQSRTQKSCYCFHQKTETNSTSSWFKVKKSLALPLVLRGRKALGCQLLQAKH